MENPAVLGFTRFTGHSSPRKTIIALLFLGVVIVRVILDWDEGPPPQTVLLLTKQFQHEKGGGGGLLFLFLLSVGTIFGWVIIIVW